MEKENLRKLVFVVILIGMTIFYGLNFMRTASDIKNCTEITTAEIINVESRTKEHNEKTETYYYPTVSYLVGEMKFSGTSREGSSSSRTYKIGDEIEIKYNPSKPSQFIIYKENGMDPMLTRIVIPIIFVFLIGVYVVFKMISDKRKS